MIGKFAIRATTQFCVAALVMALCAGGAAAQEKRWKVSGSLGVEYDDNVSTDETDSRSGQSDKALLIDLGAAYKPEFGAAYGLEIGYDFSQSLHEDLDRFDLQTHSVSASVEREVAPWDLGFIYLYSRSLLDGDDFLGIHSLTPSVGRAVNEQWYVSLRYGLQVKDFKQGVNDPRDAVNNGLTFDNFIFFDQARSYVSLGYRIEGEDADGRQFDYLGHFFHARAKLRLPIDALQKWNPVARLGLEFWTKDYDNVTPSIGAKRDDDRTTISAALQLDLTDHVNSELAVENIEASSNLPSADFDETIVTFRIGVKY